MARSFMLVSFQILAAQVLVALRPRVPVPSPDHCELGTLGLGKALGSLGLILGLKP